MTRALTALISGWVAVRETVSHLRQSIRRFLIGKNPPKIRLADVFLDGPIIRGKMSVEMPKGGMDKMTAEDMRQLAIDYLQKIVDDLNDPFSDGVVIGVKKMQTAKNEAAALLNAFKNWEIDDEAILEETCAPCMENLGIPEQRAQEIKELVLMLHLYDKMKGEKPNE